MTHTAPPVPKEPSTVRSATSKNAVGQVYANGHDAPDQALRTGTRQSTRQVGKSCNDLQKQFPPKRYTFLSPVLIRESGEE